MTEFPEGKADWFSGLKWAEKVYQEWPTDANLKSLEYEGMRKVYSEFWQGVKDYAEHQKRVCCISCEVCGAVS
jgi:hypothetical protein